MMQRDRASAALGMVVHSTEPGRSVVPMKIRDDMLNGFDVTHGGIVFALRRHRVRLPRPGQAGT